MHYFENDFLKLFAKIPTLDFISLLKVWCVRSQSNSRNDHSNFPPEFKKHLLHRNHHTQLHT